MVVAVYRPVWYCQRMTKKIPTSGRISARERLLIAAEELFYQEGVNTVGIDRIIEQAGVAKASLYDCFGSKDELIRAYLAQRHQARQRRMTEKLERYPTPKEKLLGIFDVMDELFAQPGFRGCAFVRASAEGKTSNSVKDVCDTSRLWFRTMLTELAQKMGVKDPVSLAQQFVLLYDGASVSAQMDGNFQAAKTARIAASLMLEAAVKAAD